MTSHGFKLYFFSALATLTLSACSSSPKHETTQQEPPSARVESTSEAAQIGRFDIMTSPDLTAEQKTRFMKVMNETQTKVAIIKKEESDVKVLLFRSLAKGQYNRHEVNRYKTQLKKLEDKKMNLMFTSLDQVKDILESAQKHNPDFFDQFRSRMQW